MVHFVPLFNPNPEIPPRVLATDLDGTFIPLSADPCQWAALDVFRRHKSNSAFLLVFATGRHFDSTLDAVRQFNLPPPDWIVCDVGTSIHRRVANSFVPFAPFETHLLQTVRGIDRSAVESALNDVPGLALQPPERQRPFKISFFSEPGSAESLADLSNKRLADALLPFACHASVDPFHGVGLLDVLPVGATKAAALDWLSSHADFSPDEIVFAGDSGHDLPALASGFRSIVVANAVPGLADRAERMLAARNLSSRLFRSSLPASAGVLEGARHFGLIPP